MTSNRPRPQGILVGVGSLAVIVAGFVASAIPPADAALRYGVLVVTVFAFTAIADAWAAAIAVGLIGYLVFDGFLVNQLGELSWHGPADLTRLVAVAAAVTFGRLIGDGYRASRRLRSEAPPPPGVRPDPSATTARSAWQSSRPQPGPSGRRPLARTFAHTFDKEEKRDA